MPRKEEIQKDIEDDREHDEKNVKLQALKNVGRGLLEVADVVVDVAADVFSPVGVCFKAVKLVLQLSAACKKSLFAESLQTLLSSKGERVIRIFAPYATGISPDAQDLMSESLKSTLYQLMVHFLSICADCAIATGLPKPKRLRGKLSMYKRVVTRVIAGDAAAVKAREERLDDLLGQLKATIPANTHADVLEVKAATQGLVDQFSRHTSLSLDDSNLTRIKEHLGFDHHNRNWGYWKRSYKSLLDSTLVDTGEWIKSNEDLVEWRDVDKSVPNVVLALEAPNGSGKTHACFWLLRHLVDLQKNSDNQTTRANVAHCFFESPGDTEKIAGSSETGMSLRDALAGLVLQLTETDVSFRTFVAKQCHQVGNTTYNGHDIWDNLIMDYLMAFSKQSGQDANDRKKSDTKAGRIFFLVIDGLEMAQGSQQDEDNTVLVRHIIESIRCHQNQTSSMNAKRNQPFQVRLFISGTEDYLKKVSTPGCVPRVSLCECNANDLNAFIGKKGQPALLKLEDAKSRLEKKLRLLARSGRLRISMKTIDIDLFRKKLIEESKNNYIKLQSYLEAIERASDKKLEEILSSDSLSEVYIIDSVRNSIDTLAKELRTQSQEIDVLNEILPWIVLPKEGRPTVAQLESVLRLKYGRAVNIKERIEQKYKSRSLLWCRDDVVFMSSNALDYLKREGGTATDNPIATSGQTNNVQKPNRAILHRAQQPESNERALRRDAMPSYSGESSFEKYSHGEPSGISYHRVDGHCRIILSLLKAVCPANAKIAEPLHDYAINNMLWHLSEVNPAEILTLGVERKREIGRWLYVFFMNENSVRVWFREERLSSILGDDWWESLDAVLRWFQDVEVAEGALSVLGTGGSSLILERKDLLERASEILASEWLLKSSWDAAKAFRRIAQLPKEIVDLEMSDQMRDRIRYDPDDNEGITFEHVRAAERWAQTKLKENKTKALRHTRIAETMVFYDMWDGVPSRCQKALENDSQNWKAKWYLARSLQRQNDHAGAVHQLLELMNLFKDNPGIKKKYHSAFEDIFKRFLDSSQDLDDKGPIQTFLKSFIDKPVSDPNLIAITLRQLKEAEYANSIETFFRNLLERESGQGFIELLFRFAEDKSFHENLSNKLRNIPDLLLQGYRRAIYQAHQKAQTADSLSESRLAHLRYYLAVALLYPRLPDSASRATVAGAMVTDGLDQKLRSIEEARQVLQRSVNRWKRRDCPQDVEKIILGKSTRALGFAYVEWARAQSQLTDGLVEPELRDGLPKLELLKQQQDERLVEQDLRFATLVARTYRHLGKGSLAEKHTRRVIEIAFAILDDDIPDNDWEGYDILAQALASLGREKDALAAWSLVSQAVEDEDDNSRSIDDKDKPSKGTAISMNRSVINVTTDRVTGFDGDDDSDDRSELGYEDDQAITGSVTQQPAQPHSGVFFVCNGNCGYEWQGRIEQDMYLCMDCANVRLEHGCLKKLEDAKLARRICAPDHKFLPVEKWTKEGSPGVGKDKVKVGHEVFSVKDWREGIRKKYLQ
ncbi:hypothetical protein PFICI_04946 [Pestalotiopsis fici W106-1]|uniref:Nephrocystin 3-like N-terminal domain-containing protein n=1 Tax=Pestalotiopsis fici (strain W106-1 / CGMCC3.15140) TaxID=1229662 RepID=W3XAI9_PESFW|nr:uncharacterized protein PFICI_04946 [Pestalotiopsis fici W106-1]ETS83070.1 hypothetical protein PFICI_04946 [Pestalotiopsis fici W106-1]